MNEIRVVNGSKSFGSHQVLKEVNIVCPPGGIYGIVGRNGSGKTVLFKCICGFLTLDSGEIYVGDKRMKKDINMLTGAGIIIEEPSFLRTYSGYKNLEFLYMIRNKKNKQHICEVLEQVGLEPGSRKHVGNYSMGMRQRLAIAQAVMENQDILILDEPMNGLDNHGVEEMRNLFLKLKQQGKTILLASHNREDIEILCDEVYEMDGGVLQKRQKSKQV